MAGDGSDRLRVSVLGGFRMLRGEALITELPLGSQRLLAFLALRDRAVTRSAVADALWPESSEEHAQSSLRSALSRLRKVAREGVLVTPLELCIGSEVSSDLREARALAHRLLVRGVTPQEADLVAASIVDLSLDLLPGWYDDWVVMEAEDWRQLRLHALEVMAEQLLAAGRAGDAIAAARAAIRVDPLRESAHAGLIRVHLAEGNQSEALAAYDDYSAVLQAELGIAPTQRLTDLVRSIRER